MGLMKRKLLVVLAIVAAAVACTNCCCMYYWPHPVQWYNDSFEVSPNMIIGLMIMNMGPEPVTILDSDTNRINFSIKYVVSPWYYQKVNDSCTVLLLSLDGSDVYPGYASETLVYLPHGPNYTLMISGGGLLADESPVVTKYSGGNLTLWVNDPDHFAYNLHYTPGLEIVKYS